MEQNPNLGFPPAWLQLHTRAVTFTGQCILLIFWLHCSLLQMKRESQGNPEGFPTASRYGGILPWTSGGGRECCILPNLQYWPTSSASLFSMFTGDKAIFCSQAFSGLCYLKQISLASQRQHAEQSIMCILCLPKPLGQSLTEENVSLLKKCIIFTQPEDRADIKWS